ncbi:MAG: ABC transporter substrate-binding protein [Oscillospiraceae bacterium]|nr:ABC transporter substrate-binding protein [Oscillospiraceae bacterium]
MRKFKFLAVLLCLAMLLTFAAACNKDDDTPSASNSPGTSSEASASPSNSGQTSTSPSGNEASPGNTDSGPAAAGGVERDTFSVAVDSDAGLLDPVKVSGGMYVALMQLYESLWDIDENGNMIYKLMESYEDHGNFWRCKLREGVYFSSGVELKASDVIFSLGYWKAQPVNAVRVQSLDLERSCVHDEYTVDLYMLNDYYYFHDTGSCMMMIFCEEGFDEDDISINPNGTGPYEVKDYVVNSHLFLERKDEYWGEKPAIKNLNFRVLAEPSQVVNALTTGMIDYAPIQLADFDYVDGLSGFYTISRYIGGGVGLSFNSGVNGYFNRFTDGDKKLEARFAVYHAINPQVLINLVYEGKGRIMHNMVPDYMFDYKDEYDHWEPAYDIGYNVERAKELAQSSGLAGQTISIMTNGLAAAVQTAEIVQSMLAAIDVTLEINNYDPATALSMIYDPEASHDITVGAGIAPNSRVCDLLLNGVRYSSTLTLPGSFTNNEHYLAICAQMAHEPDNAKRVAITEECLRMYTDNAIGFGLCVYQTCYAMADDVQPDTVVYSVTSNFVRYEMLKFK